MGSSPRDSTQNAFDKTGLTMHVCDRWDVTILRGLRMSLLQEVARLRNLAKTRQHKGQVEFCSNSGVLPEAESKTAISINVAEGDRAFKVLVCATELALEPLR